MCLLQGYILIRNSQVPGLWHGWVLGCKFLPKAPEGLCLAIFWKTRQIPIMIQTSQLADNVFQIQLNRPEVFNALNTKTLMEINETLHEIEHDSNIRVLIFTGSGEKAFCAGADLKERKDMDDNATLAFVHLISSTMRRIFEWPVPTIAKMNGVAFGGGLELALACDMRLSTSTAQMGLTECGLGIIPGAGGTQLLPKVVGMAKAKEMIFGAKRVGAAEARSIGLVNEVYSSQSDLDAETLSIARGVAANAPLAVRAAKSAIHDGMFVDDIRKGFEVEHGFYNEILESTDRLEALKAFAEKRKPVFVGE